MKTFYKIILVSCLCIAANFTKASTIGVAPLKTYGLNTLPSTAAKMVRLELIKFNKFIVLDEFDMNEVAVPGKDDCYSKDCLVEYGAALKVDYMISGNIDGFENKIVVNLKLIDVKNRELAKSTSKEFANQEMEIQRMIGLTLQEMFDVPKDLELERSLSFKNEMITSDNIGRVSNAGPRMGVAVAYGELNEFFTRSETNSGLGIQPVVTNIGYQFEGQYVGTENFSALFEFIPSLTGLEQGQFIPSISILNGFRFGKGGWEFAFGPGIGLTKTSNGFFDDKGIYGEQGKYWDYYSYGQAGFSTSSLTENGYSIREHMDSNGDVKLSTRWIMAFGRTFRSGALNIPVNVFWSSQKRGGMIGASVGFNIIRSKSPINK